MSENKPPKTDKEFATDVMKMAVGTIVLLRPTSPEDMDSAMSFGSTVIESMLEGHIRERVESAIRETSEVLGRVTDV